MRAANMSAAQSDHDGSRKALATMDSWLIATLVLAIVQGAFFALAPTAAEQRLTGTALAVLAVFEAWHPTLLGRQRARGAWILAALVVANFSVHITNSTPPYPYRALQAGVIYGYSCLAVAGVIRMVRPSAGRLATALAVVVLGVILGVEQRLEREQGKFLRGGGVQWRTMPGSDSHDGIGTFLANRYPRNARGYLGKPAAARTKWQLMTHDSSSTATLQPLAQPSSAITVDIAGPSTGTLWNVQLNDFPIRLRARQRLALSFRARATRPHRIAAAVSLGRAPWTGLGLYREVALDTTWRAFAMEFTVMATEDSARLHFDLGDDSVRVDLARIALRDVRTGAEVRARSGEGEVTYRLNALGCRGETAPADTAVNVRKILVIGDGAALGEGVREEDTFSARLPSLLAAADTTGPAPRRYVVYNCGAPRFRGSEVARRLPALQSTYAPDAVLLALSPVSVSPDLPETRWQRLLSVGKLDQLLLTLNALERSWAHELPGPADSAETLTGLAPMLRELGQWRVPVTIGIFPPPRIRLELDRYAALRESLRREGYEVIDLVPGATDGVDPARLVVDADYDWHPNELSHALAAQRLAGVLCCGERRSSRSARRVAP